MHWPTWLGEKMINLQNYKLELISGRLTHLRVEDSEENFVSSGDSEVAAGATAIGLAAAGLAGAATNSVYAASGGTDSIQSFTGILEGKRISGRFSKIWFKNGDHLECAVDRQADDTYAVFAVRRPSDQTLWMFPHCSRGRKKHWKYARKMSVVLALLMTAGLLLCLTPMFGLAFWRNEDSHMGATIFTIMGLTMGFYFSLNTARRWAPFVAIAESIFTTFGYPDPEQVDMPEQDNAFWKKNASAGAASDSAPWVFRYLA
jgi:hypothetical protein